MLTRRRFFSISIFFVVFFLLFAIFASTSPGKTPHDYFLRLSGAFLEGRWWLTENPSWLNELIPDHGKYYVVYPPMPAILMMPFVFVFGEKFEQQWFAHLVGVSIAFLSGYLGFIISRRKSVGIWTFLLAGLGTINWYHASTGSVWLLGQLVAELFLLAALVECFGKKRGFWVGLLLGCAYWSRLQTIVSIPLFLYLLTGERKRIIIFILPVVFFILANFLYNYIRFGSVFDLAYIKIPGVLSEPWYRYGLFNLKYIPEHLSVIFAQLPRFLTIFPYIQPSWAGLAIWVTTPAFLYSLRARVNERMVQFLWLVILAISIVNFSHGSTGFAQFGYRFGMDFYPFLLILTIKGVGKHLTLLAWFLLGVGLLVNLWGVLWINKFNWVGW